MANEHAITWKPESVTATVRIGGASFWLEVSRSSAGGYWWFAGEGTRSPLDQGAARGAGYPTSAAARAGAEHWVSTMRERPAADAGDNEDTNDE